MQLKKEQIKLYLITDRTWLKEGETLVEKVEAALKAGATMVQFREKQLTGEDYIREAKNIQAVCSAYHVPFIINDHVELAKEINADGVHVGLMDMAVEKAVRILGQQKLVGASAHNVDEAVAAWKAGASYLGCGAVFASGTKTNTVPLSYETLREICRAVPIPVAAIGGITLENIHKLYGCGADGAAVISAVFSKNDPQATVKLLLDAVSKLAEENV